MEKRKLGNKGLEVSALGLGCMGLSFGYGSAVVKPEAIKLIRTAYEEGITFFDTAEYMVRLPTKNCWAKLLRPLKAIRIFPFLT